MGKKGKIMWYDKYFHFWQRKNVFDVYLEKFINCLHEKSKRVVVVFYSGNKGTSGIGLIGSATMGICIGLKEALQKAYEEAMELEQPKPKTDYEKYLLPTIGTTRPDPALVSYIEEGFIPNLTRNRNQPRTDPSPFPPKGRKQ